MKKLLFVSAMVLFACNSFAQWVPDTLSMQVAAAPKIKPLPENAKIVKNDVVDPDKLNDVTIKNVIFAENNRLMISPLLKVFKREELENKAIVMIFWSADCNSCTANFATISRLLKKHQMNKDLMVVAITKDNNKTATEKLKETPLLYTEFVNNATALINAYQSPQEPSYIITDKQHKIIYAVSGTSDVVMAGFKRTLDSNFTKVK